jgi:hypothetical protein
VVGLGFVYRLNGGPQVGPAIQSNLPELIAGQKLLAEIVRPAYVVLFNRSAVV